ncbi:MAG: hypothetical protein DDT25_00850 [Chloroflexi bacterium]|nr:hypothetical protein [Chloroflexota bacterium]
MLLARYKTHNIRMVYVQDRHISTASHPTLLDDIGGRIKDPHEGNRATGNATGGAYLILLRPQPREGEPGATAALVDKSGVFYRIEDRFHGILYRQNEACRELSQLSVGIHQRGGIGQKLQIGHYPIEFLFPYLNICLRVVYLLGRGNMVRHPAEQFLRRFYNLSIPILSEITSLQHHHSIG